MSINADQLVSVTPRVINAGGDSLELNGLALTRSPLVPSGRVLQYPDASAVAQAFGAQSAEATFAAAYFKGFDNATIKPTRLYVASYVDEAKPAWLRGAPLALTLAELQAVTSGSLSITIDNTPRILQGLNFAAVTSFSDAAQMLQSALTLEEGDPVPSAPVVTYSSLTRAFQITSGTRGEGSAVGYATAVGSGMDLAALLGLRQADGALQSDGMDARSPAQNMAAVLESTLNWVCFSTVWEPDLATKLLLAAWNNSLGKPRYVYVPWDTDVTACQSLMASDFGSRLGVAGYCGCSPVYGGADLAAFVLGVAACIDVDRTNGRLTFAYKAQDGQPVTVSDGSAAQALLAKGYNFYGSYHTANDEFRFFQNGQITGSFAWLDTHINAVCIYNDLQLAILNLFASVNSLPYNEAGYDQVRAACKDPIVKYLNFGAIVPGVPLSHAQAAQVNREAGQNIAPTLERDGWYLQIKPATAQNRAARDTPPCSFWYMDGGSIQRLDMASTTIL